MENFHGEHPHSTHRESDGSKHQRWSQKTEHSRVTPSSSSQILAHQEKEGKAGQAGGLQAPGPLSRYVMASSLQNHLSHMLHPTLGGQNEKTSRSFLNIDTNTALY